MSVFKRLCRSPERDKVFVGKLRLSGDCIYILCTELREAFILRQYLSRTRGRWGANWSPCMVPQLRIYTGCAQGRWRMSCALYTEGVEAFGSCHTLELLTKCLKRRVHVFRNVYRYSCLMMMLSLLTSSSIYPPSMEEPVFVILWNQSFLMTTNGSFLPTRGATNWL